MNSHFISIISVEVQQGDTVCALIFMGFNVRSFRGLAAFHKCFVHKNLDISGYAQNNGQHLRILQCKIHENINPRKLKCIQYII